MPEYDLAVIGTGVAATAVARRCRSAGWRVAVIDSRPFGGTCALRGCDPKKVLWTLAEAADRNRRLADAGLSGRSGAFDWPAAMAFKRRFTEPVPEERENAYRAAGIDGYHGAARFTGPTRLDVAGREVAARHVVIAAGAVPRPLAFPGAERLASSDRFLDLDALPGRLVFVGGGYVSFELATIAARAGAAPVILHRSERPLKAFEPDLVDRAVAAARQAGIEVQLECPVAGVDAMPDGALRLRCQDGRAFGADLAVHGAGRVPDLDGLDLDAAGIARDDKGRLALDDHLRSVSNPAVYAAGDAAQKGPPLTPVASLDAEVVAANLLGEARRPVYRGVPSVVFTIPPLAAVGLGEAAARGSGRRVRVNGGDASDWYEARRDGTVAAYKVLIDDDSGRILGAHLLAPEAPEVINLFALAIRLGLKAEDLGRLVSAYPSWSSTISYMLEK